MELKIVSKISSDFLPRKLHIPGTEHLALNGFYRLEYYAA